jgi:hypothetical protein
MARLTAAWAAGNAKYPPLGRPMTQTRCSCYKKSAH